MDLRIPPLELEIMLESNPLKSTILVRRLAAFLDGSSAPPRGAAIQPVPPSQRWVAAHVEGAAHQRPLRVRGAGPYDVRGRRRGGFESPPVSSSQTGSGQTLFFYTRATIYPLHVDMVFATCCHISP